MSADQSDWTVYITNDNCPDYTWGFTEEQTRQCFAGIVAAHLDEMTRTDGEAPEAQDRYNMAVTQEALCFVERYPDRREELIRRIKEGRVFVSPYLCNTLWGFQSFEGALRAFYPAHRLERDWGIPFGLAQGGPLAVAEHIEEPSLPWGVASILAGCGIRWLSNPFYAYDSTFAELENPPLFIFEGPDGGRVRVVMDPWACNRASYTQGAKLLAHPETIAQEWVPHYQALGEKYPLQVMLASGTHGDINPNSGQQAAPFADAIRAYNQSPEPHPRLVNATLPQFCEQVDRAEERRRFLPVIRGCFGHSWDLWPVSLARCVAELRQNERDFLAAETLVALASATRPEIVEGTRTDRERGEWCWAMLGDHAWNGTDDANKDHNARLRRNWNQELRQIVQRLLTRGWSALGLRPAAGQVTICNSLSLPRADLVCLETPDEVGAVHASGTDLPAQMVEEDGARLLYFVSPVVRGFGLETVELRSGGASNAPQLSATTSALEGPHYRLTIDQRTGGIGSLICKATGMDAVADRAGRGLCETVYFDGQEHVLRDVVSEVLAEGPVLARVRITGQATDVRVSNLVTVYAELDRVDFDLRVTKARRTQEERLCHVFPVLGKGGQLRIETPGAVITPKRQPEGDLLPGADTSRFAVQGFLDVSWPEGGGVMIAPLDSFALRLDLGPPSFEALGNDQNYREVTQDQHGVTEFRFRYSLRGYAGGYDQARALAWSRSVGTPLLAVPGAAGELPTAVAVDPGRAVATCLKPADDGRGCMLRLWETAGRSGALSIGVKGYRRAARTDLLERDIEELQIEDGNAKVDLPAFGFAGLRLTR